MQQSPRKHPSFDQFEIELIRLGSPAAFRQLEQRLPASRQVYSGKLKSTICLGLARLFKNASEWLETRAGQPA